MSKAKRRERQRLGVCKRTGSLALDHPDDTVTLTCIRTAEHPGRHRDPNFGPWSDQ